MKFKISIAKNPSHSGPVTCIGWSSTEEVYSAGDDSQLLSWSVSNNTSRKLSQLPKDLYPIDMQFLPRTSGSLGKHGDLILLTSADGKFHIMNRSGRVERTVEAHNGAILVGQWSNDGAGLLTAGEDGCIKVWSRSGMLRSVVVSSDNSVYGAAWSPDSQSIAHTQGKFLVIKHLAPNTKPLKWKAHEELVLCLAWSPVTELLISGGEDCRYRVWDAQGRQLFSSSLHDNHITALAWAPSGDLFAVGSYNTLRLCDYSGWSRSLEKPNTGCVYKMAWSSDGTQLAGACASGHVFFAHVVERHVHYQNFSASVSERKIIAVRNVADDSLEHLELPERVIQLSLKYTHLVATTPSQCYIYSTNNWNTPVIFDLKDGSVILLQLSEKHMLIVEKTNIAVYNYQGRVVASPRWPNMRLDSLRSGHVSLSNDTLVVRDSVDGKLVHVVDLSSRSSTESSSTVQHSIPIVQVALDQCGGSQTRLMAMTDKTKDLYVVSVRSSYKTCHKLGRKTESFHWNTESNIIATMQDTQLVVWYCPTAAFDRDLLKLCSMQYGAPELGRNPRISDFVGNSVSVRRADGSLINIPISPFPPMLHKFIQDNKWTDALNLCRSVKEQTLWACLAVLTIQTSADMMDIAEEAFANINHYDKVFYIQHIKELSGGVQQKAAIALLGGAPHESESILLHNGMVFQAIYNNVQSHNWSRALDLAIKHKTHIDTVLHLRRNYLESLGKAENDNKFAAMKENASWKFTKLPTFIWFTGSARHRQNTTKTGNGITETNQQVVLRSVAVGSNY